MNLLLVAYEHKSYYQYIKDFNRFMFNKIKNKKNNYFAKVNYSVLVVKICRKNTICKIRKRATEFIIQFKQISVQCKMHAKFECHLKIIESYERSH